MELFLMASGDIVTVAVAGGIVLVFFVIALAGGFKGLYRRREARLKEKRAAEKAERENAESAAEPETKSEKEN